MSALGFYWMMFLVTFLVFLFSRSKFTTFYETRNGTWDFDHNNIGKRFLMSIFYALIWPFSIFVIGSYYIFMIICPTIGDIFFKLDNWLHKDNKI